MPPIDDHQYADPRRPVQFGDGEHAQPQDGDSDIEDPEFHEPGHGELFDDPDADLDDEGDGEEESV